MKKEQKKKNKDIIVTGGCVVVKNTGEILRELKNTGTQELKNPRTQELKKREMPKPAEIPVGIQCRNCGCRHFDVTHKIPISGNRERRYMKCRYCGLIHRTIEMVEKTTSHN